MRTILLPLVATIAGIFRTRSALQLEILALRQQLAVLIRIEKKRPRVRLSDRLFMVAAMANLVSPESAGREQG